jgi:hypothetical protein
MKLPWNDWKTLGTVVDGEAFDTPTEWNRMMTPSGDPTDSSTKDPTLGEAIIISKRETKPQNCSEHLPLDNGQTQWDDVT